MMAEAVHSLVDVANQMLLRVGIKKATKVQLGLLEGGRVVSRLLVVQRTSTQ